MPIYEYKCESCAHGLEAMQKMNEPSLKDCPACGKPSLKRLVSAAGFQLKGSGWYASDYKDNKKKKDNGETSGDIKTDTKTETKTDTGAKKVHGCGSGSCGCA